MGGNDGYTGCISIGGWVYRSVMNQIKEIKQGQGGGERSEKMYEKF